MLRSTLVSLGNTINYNRKITSSGKKCYLRFRCQSFGKNVPGVWHQRYWVFENTFWVMFCLWKYYAEVLWKMETSQYFDVKISCMSLPEIWHQYLENLPFSIEPHIYNILGLWNTWASGSGADLEHVVT